MNFPHHWSTKNLAIRSKITLLFIGVVVGFLFLSFGVQSHITEKALKNAIHASALDLARASAQAIDRFLADSADHARVIAQSLPEDVVRSRDTAAAQAILKKMTETYPVFENGLFLLANDGTLWADYPPHPETHGKSLIHREYYQKSILKDRGVVGEPYRSLRTGEPVLTFTEILRDAAGERIGLIGCSTRLDSDLALGGVQGQGFGKTGYAYVYDKSRLMILHPDRERILQRDVPPGSNRLFDAAINGFEGVGETINSRNIPMLLALVQVPRTDWIVGVQQPQAEVFAPLEDARLSALVLLGMGALVAGGAGALSIRHLTSPLSILQEAAQGLETSALDPSGTLDDNKREQRARLLRVVGSGDEIGRLAGAFISMDRKLSETLKTISRASREWEKTFDAVDDALFVTDSEQRVVRLNRAAADLLGVDFSAALEQPLRELLFGAEPPPETALWDHLFREGGATSFETRALVARGDFEISGTPVKSGEEGRVGAVFVVRNVTHRNQLEMHLRQAHKTEALGTLASGIAHDFNNILSAVLGSAELIRLKLQDQQNLHRFVDEIINAGERGADLVRALMSYCREEVPEKSVVSVNDLLANMQTMVKRLLGRSIELNLKLGPGPMHVLGSKAQVEQVLMNLVINARDAMPDGGLITIETAASDQALSAKGAGVQTLALRVSDTGVGMPAEAVGKIFDPFFTTKPEGTGTGLGLSIVQGIVNSHGGQITACSRPGRGTTFTILLPLADHGAATEPIAV